MRGVKGDMTSAVLDKETFCAQVIRHQDALFRAAKAILRSDEDAEDAVQEAICAAFAAREQLRDPQRFKPWMLRIVVNQSYELCRKRKPTVDLDQVADYLPAGDQDPTEHLALWQAVLSLSDDLRSAITLFYYEGLSVREIAAVLNISESAVKTRLSRGREKLRRLLYEQ